MDIDVEVDLDVNSCFGWLSKSVQVLFVGAEAVMVGGI